MKISSIPGSVLLALLAMATSSATAETRMQVAAASTPVHTRPSAEAPQAGKASSGEILFVSRIEGDWAAISPPDRLDVWLNKDFIEGNRVIAKSIQIRSGPGVQYDVVGTLERGAPVMPRGEDGDWCKIAPPSSVTLWVKKGDLSEITVRTTPIREVATAPKPAPLPAPPPVAPPPEVQPAPQAEPRPEPRPEAPAPEPAYEFAQATAAPIPPPPPAPATLVKVAPSDPKASAPQPVQRPAPAPAPAPSSAAPMAASAAPARHVTETVLAPAAPVSAPAPQQPQIAPPPPIAARPQAAPRATQPAAPALRPATAIPGSTPQPAAANIAAPVRRPAAKPATVSKPAPAPAVAVAAQKPKEIGVQVDQALVDDLDLDESMPNQGKAIQVEGELRNAPFMAGSPSRYRLVDTDEEGVLEMVCHVHGDSNELRDYVGKGISIRGREYWVEESDMPVVVVGRIVPLEPADEPVIY